MCPRELGLRMSALEVPPSILGARARGLARGMAHPRAVTIVAFADEIRPELQVLASSVAHLHREGVLNVLGLSGESAPHNAASLELPPSVKRNSQRRPNIIKRLVFLSGFLDARPDSEAEPSAGLRDDDLVVFVDGYDVLLQRRVAELPDAYDRLLQSMGAPKDAAVISGEMHCWPWVNPGEEHGRTRDLSTGYLRNESFRLQSGQMLKSTDVCQTLARSTPGHWPYPNGGSWIAPVRTARKLMLLLRSMLLEGHYDDTAMLGLALLQNRPGAPSLLVDANATLFSTQFAYESSRWERPACFSDYFDHAGEPPWQHASKDDDWRPGPFFLHFNGPSGKWRHGWCTNAFARAFARDGQHLLDVDAQKRRGLPRWCGGAVAPSGHAAEAATGHGVPPQRECKAGELRLRCTNDHCQEAHEERIEERRERKSRREGDRGLVASQHGEQGGGGSDAHAATAHPSSERVVAKDELRQKQAQRVVEPDGEGGSQGGIYSMHDVAFAVGLVGLVALLAREIRERWSELRRCEILGKRRRPEW